MFRRFKAAIQAFRTTETPVVIRCPECDSSTLQVKGAITGADELPIVASDVRSDCPVCGYTVTVVLTTTGEAHVLDAEGHALTP